MHRARIMRDRHAEEDVAHLVFRILIIPFGQSAHAALGVGEVERQFGSGHDRKAAGLVARIDEADVRNAITSHVVVVRRSAELRRRVDRHIDSAVRRLVDRLDPGLHAECLERVRARNPVCKAQVDFGSRSRCRQAQGERQCSQCLCIHNSSLELSGDRYPPRSLPNTTHVKYHHRTMATAR